MNERIRELAEQAGLEYDFNPMLWLKYEKFAELIIRECADIADINAHQHQPPGSYVRQHFGVE